MNLIIDFIETDCLWRNITLDEDSKYLYHHVFMIDCINKRRKCISLNKFTERKIIFLWKHPRVRKTKRVCRCRNHVVRDIQLSGIERTCQNGGP